MKKLYVVGQVKKQFPEGHRYHGKSIWEFTGAFDSVDKAEKACISDDYFIGECELNKAFPDNSVVWPGAYYPRLENGAY